MKGLSPKWLFSNNNGTLKVKVIIYYILCFTANFSHYISLSLKKKKKGCFFVRNVQDGHYRY